MPVGVGGLTGIGNQYVYFYLHGLFIFLLVTSPSPSISLFSGLFPVRGVEVSPCSKSQFLELSEFFTRSFWADKKNGSKIGERGLGRLREMQLAEFRRRYSVQRKSILLLASRPGKGKGKENARRGGGGGAVSSSTNILLGSPPSSSSAAPNREIIGCIAVDLTNLSSSETNERFPLAPVMSNLAVDKRFRGRGVASVLIKEIERKIKNEYSEEFLYLKVDADNNKAKVSECARPASLGRDPGCELN